MLFNSLPFILVFLPLSLIAYFGIGRISGGSAARVTLATLSFVFYAYWDVRFLPLLLLSIITNFSIGLSISKADINSKKQKYFIAGIVFNLGLLFVFKYANLIVSTYEQISATKTGFPEIILPIGISFFTFTQIAFLVDVYRLGAREYRFWDYALFVSYFPHQIAGPILHHKEMLEQFRAQQHISIKKNEVIIGLCILAIGLGKKLFLADVFDSYASPVFSAGEQGVALRFFEAWGAALAYTLQLYFDFSGYSDMAVGISLIFGIRMPENFYSPYKAKNIIDFGRRWHITLSRFLREYLYISLGGNRNGKIRRYINLMLTMGLGGLWHGASWTFLFWGLLHGFYLTINHLWRDFGGHRIKALTNKTIYVSLSWSLTFCSVVVAWVFFRAATFSGALQVLKGMFAVNGFALPPSLASALPHLAIADADWSGSLGGIRALAFIGLGLLFVVVLPNTQQLFSEFRPVLEKKDVERIESRFVWRPNFFWALFLGTIVGLGLTRLGQDSAFLYFNF